MTSSNGNIYRVTGTLWGEITGHRWIPLTKSSDAGHNAFFYLPLNKRLSKQSWGWWFETPPRSLWRQCNDSNFIITNYLRLSKNTFSVHGYRTLMSLLFNSRCVQTLIMWSKYFSYFTTYTAGQIVGSISVFCFGIFCLCYVLRSWIVKIWFLLSLVTTPFQAIRKFINRFWAVNIHVCQDKHLKQSCHVTTILTKGVFFETVHCLYWCCLQQPNGNLSITLQWHHNERDGVSNHQPHDCLLNRLFRGRSQKTLKLRATGLCVGNSPVTGEFPAQRSSNAENVSFDDVIMESLFISIIICY